MPYVVLARRWRPQRFEEVVGQRHVTGTLVNAIRTGRVANAYLFSGPRGVGKTTVARILAKAINCDFGPTPEPCNQCTPCVEITEGRSLDVLEIDGASNRGVDEVRNLRENLRYAASPGKSKIYIIDEVHMLTTEAFNALLKTLEEPPPRVLFIFATTEPHKVPLTILSRCQRFEFHRLPVELIVEQLGRICQVEGITADPEALHMIAVKADGSMRDAESLLDQVVAFSGGEVTRERVVELAGMIDRELLLRLGQAILSADVRQAAELAREAHGRGYDFGEFLNACAEFFRDLLMIRSVGTAGADIPESVVDRYREQAEAFSDEDLLRLVKIASDAAYRLRFTPNPRVRFELALVRMAKLRKSVELAELLKAVGQSVVSPEPTGVASKPPVRSSPSGDRRSPPSPSSSAQPGGSWGKWTAARGSSSAELRTGAQSAVVTTSAAVTMPAKEPSRPVGVSEGSSPRGQAVGKIDLTLEEVRRQWDEAVAVVRKKRVALGVFLAEARPKGLRDKVLELAFGPESTFQMDSVRRHREEISTILRENLGWDVALSCIREEDGNSRRPRPTALARLQALEELAQENPVVRKILDDFDAELIL